jgi:1,4-alpha-glucan branching enzyme
MGLHMNKGISYREWAPNAVQASLIGEFSKLFNIAMRL